MDSILIYQMGKVGSAAIRDSLDQMGINNYQVHYLDPDAVERQLEQHRRRGLRIPPHLERSKEIIASGILGAQSRTRVVSLIRDPVSRNISAFFQNLASYFPGESWKDTSSEVLINTFLERYPHRISVDWFRDEFMKTLGIDVLEGDVNPEDFVFRFRRANTDVLLLKVEAHDEIKESAINEFLGLGGSFKLLKTNIGETKNYADAYKAFKQKIKLPRSYLDELYGSTLITKFYTPMEIAKFRKKWAVQ